MAKIFSLGDISFSVHARGILFLTFSIKACVKSSFVNQRKACIASSSLIAGLLDLATQAILMKKNSKRNYFFQLWSAQVRRRRCSRCRWWICSRWVWWSRVTDEISSFIDGHSPLTEAKEMKIWVVICYRCGPVKHGSVLRRCSFGGGDVGPV